MSGICGIVHVDGEPVDRQLLLRMTQFLHFRGPDAQDVWLDGSVGLGHAMLRTTHEAEHERQPATLDGAVWITADARIDGRPELKAALAAKGRTNLEAATDPELILHSYHVWDEDCVRHLLGDFAFAIWDPRKKALFCARDQLGIKPFYYAALGNRFVFSNTLRCVQQHPAISRRLNDLAIADFLLFEDNQDPHSTAFQEVLRLPPATSLVAGAEGCRLRRYWSLPTNGSVQYRRQGDYVEHFRHLLWVSVADRLRTRRVGVDMSGGLDSPAVAALALKWLRRDSAPFSLHAHTLVYDRIIADEERRFAALAAEHLGIPIHYHVADDWKPFERAAETWAQLPEPGHEPHMAMLLEFSRRRAALARVYLTGFDGDALLHESPKPYFRNLLHRRNYARLTLAVLGYAARERRLPHGLKARLTLRGRQATKASSPGYPCWLNPELDARFDLRARWERAQRAKTSAHPVRPTALAALEYLTERTRFFEGFDPEFTQATVEHRHPLMDLRLWEYCLSLPPMPWCIRKTILRESMVGVLPRPILTRPKTPLAGFPFLVQLQAPGSSWMDDFPSAKGLERYVLRQQIPRVHQERSPEHAWQNLRPLSLNFWLHSNLHG